MVGRQLAARARAPRRRTRSSGADIVPHTTGGQRRREGADRGRPRPRRAGAKVGRGGARNVRGRVGQGIDIHRRSACSGGSSWRIGNLEAAGELPTRASRSSSFRTGYNDPTAPRLGRRYRDADRIGRAGASARLPRKHYEANARRLGSPWALAAACALPRTCLAAARATRRPRSKRSSAIPGRSSTDARIPSSAAGALLALGTVRRQAQQKRAARGGARAGARDLRRAGRSSLGGEGPSRAETDQRSRHRRQKS